MKVTPDNHAYVRSRIRDGESTTIIATNMNANCHEQSKCKYLQCLGAVFISPSRCEPGWSVRGGRAEKKMKASVEWGGGRSGGRSGKRSGERSGEKREVRSESASLGRTVE